MLGIEAKTVYDILSEIAGDTEVYKIIDAEEVLEKLPDGFSLTKIQLSQIIRELKDLEFVDVKYFTPDEYCLQIVRRVEVTSSQAGAAQAAQQVSVKRGSVLFMAFLGAFLGSAIVATVTALIIRFVL